MSVKRHLFCQRAVAVALAGWTLFAPTDSAAHAQAMSALKVEPTGTRLRLRFELDGLSLGHLVEREAGAQSLPGGIPDLVKHQERILAHLDGAFALSSGGVRCVRSSPDRFEVTAADRLLIEAPYRCGEVAPNVLEFRSALLPERGTTHTLVVSVTTSRGSERLVLTDSSPSGTVTLTAPPTAPSSSAALREPTRCGFGLAPFLVLLGLLSRRRPASSAPSTSR